MSTNKEVVKKVNKAFAENKPEVFLSACSDDVYWQIVGDRSFRGKKAVEEFMKSMKDMEPPKFAVDEVIEDGDTVTSCGSMTMKNKNGQTDPYSFCDIYRFRNDEIVELNSLVVKNKPKSARSGHS